MAIEVRWAADSYSVGMIPLDLTLIDKGDKVSPEETETGERSLVYAAITRVRKKALITSYGRVSEFL